MTSTRRHGAIQDTGNPVLDTTANLIMNWPCDINFQAPAIEALHATVAQLLAKEPRPGKSTALAKSGSSKR